MFISFSHLIKIAIFILGIFWCREIFARLPGDIKKLKNKKDKTTRIVIIFFWVITAGYIFFVIAFLWCLIMPILNPPI
jgi:hypothetical protein